MTTKEEKLYTFYTLCLEKNYNDMKDPTQSLKAKVIASDLGLKYGNITKLFADSKIVYEHEQQRILAEEKERVATEKRLAVIGEHILTFTFNDRSVAQVFRRPDESTYYMYDGKKIENVIVSASSSNVLTYKYHPSKSVFTGASSGGIAMGGFHETEASYSEGAKKTNKGDIIAQIGEKMSAIRTVKITEPVRQAFKRDSVFMTLVSEDQIYCFDRSSESISSTIMQQTMYSQRNYVEKTAMISQAADMSKLSMSHCIEIATLLNRIINHQYPDPDNVMYSRADTLSLGSSSKELKEAVDIYNSIFDYKDSAQKAQIVHKLYEEVLQKEKEQKILEKEADKRKLARTILIVGIFAILSMVVVIVGQNIMRINKYRSAQTLLENGKYDEAISAFQSLDGYEDSGEMIKECHYQKGLSMVKEDDLEEALTLFTNLDNYKDSSHMISEIHQKQYNLADKYEEVGQLQEALKIFRELGTFNDAESRVKGVEAKISELQMEKDLESAITYLKNGSTDAALSLLARLKNFRNANEYLTDIYFLPVELVTRANSFDGDHIYAFKYDSNGYMVSVERSYYTKSGIIKEEAAFDDKNHYVISGFYLSKSIIYDDNANEIITKISENSDFGNIHDMQYGHLIGTFSKRGRIDYTTLKYDKYHNRSQEDNWKSSSITNTYDELGRLIDVDYKTGSYVANSKIKYEAVYSPNYKIDMDLVWRNFRLLCEDEIWF